MPDDNSDVIEYLPPEFSQMPFPIQPNSNSDEVYSDLMREERVANIISQLNPENLLEDIEYRIKGYKKDRTSGTWKKIDPNAKEIPPMLVSNFISFLNSVLNNNTTFSNFSGNDINRIMKVIIEYVVDDLSDNAEAYGFKENYTERTRIALIIVGSCFTVFKRAENGMEAKRFFSALKVQEQNIAQQQQKKGLIDHLKFWN